MSSIRTRKKKHQLMKHPVCIKVYINKHAYIKVITNKTKCMYIYNTHSKYVGTYNNISKNVKVVRVYLKKSVI